MISSANQSASIPITHWIFRVKATDKWGWELRSYKRDGQIEQFPCFCVTSAWFLSLNHQESRPISVTCWQYRQLTHAQSTVTFHHHIWKLAVQYIYICLDVLSLNISWTYYYCQSHPVSLLVVFSRFLKSLDAVGIVTACLDNLLNQKLFDWLTLLNCFKQGSQKTWKPSIQHTRILPGKPQTRWTEAWKQVKEKMPTTLRLNRNKLRHALELTARGIVTVCSCNLYSQILHNQRICKR